MRRHAAHVSSAPVPTVHALCARAPACHSRDARRPVADERRRAMKICDAELIRTGDEALVNRLVARGAREVGRCTHLHAAEPNGDFMAPYCLLSFGRSRRHVLVILAEPVITQSKGAA